MREDEDEVMGERGVPRLKSLMKTVVVMRRGSKAFSATTTNKDVSEEKELSELLDCFDEAEVRIYVQRLVYAGETIPLTKAYKELVDGKSHGHRGILLVIQLYEIVFEEFIHRVKEGLEEGLGIQIIDHIRWLRDQDLDSLLRLSLIHSSEEMQSESESILHLYRQDLVERLVSTRIFRIVLRSRYECGPSFFFKFECFLFVVLFLCHNISHLMQRRAFKRRPLALQWFLLALALPPLQCITVRMQFQVHFLSSVERRLRTISRASSLASSRTSFPQKHDTKQKWKREWFLHFPLCALLEILVWLLNRFAIIISVVMFFPLIILLYVLKPQHYHICADRLRQTFFAKPAFAFTHDKYWISLPVSWRRDTLNWIEAIFIVLAWAWYIISMRYIYYRTRLKREPPFSNRIMDVLNCGTLFGWLRTMGFLTASPRYAPFVIFLTKKIFVDLRVFFLVLFILYAAFCQTLYQSIILNKSFYKRNPTDRAASLRKATMLPLGALLNEIYSYILTGEADSDGGIRYIDHIFIVVMTFIMLVVVLNVLVAIVIESYEKSMRHGERIFWRSRFETIVKCYAIFGNLLIYPAEIQEKNHIDEQVKFSNLNEPKLAPPTSKAQHHSTENMHRTPSSTLYQRQSAEEQDKNLEALLNREVIEAYRAKYFSS